MMCLSRGPRSTQRRTPLSQKETLQMTYSQRVWIALTPSGICHRNIHFYVFANIHDFDISSTP